MKKQIFVLSIPAILIICGIVFIHQYFGLVVCKSWYGFPLLLSELVVISAAIGITIDVILLFIAVDPINIK